MECSNPECRRLRRELQDELFRVKSAGYDMLKQRGVWQSGIGRTHQDLTLEYEQLFAHEVEDMVECLKENVVEEDEARKLVCNIFQKTYDRCKEHILGRMKELLGRVLSVEDESATTSSEDLYDVCRAYGLLLHASGLAKSSDVAGCEEVPQSQELFEELMDESPQLPEGEMSQFVTSASSLSWNLLTTVPPLVCAQPNTIFCRECHQKEMQPVWNNKVAEYDLMYYRPTLFLSYEGKVARKGWVGNKERLSEDNASVRCSRTQEDQSCNTLQGSPLTLSAHEEQTCAAVSKSLVSYPKPLTSQKCLLHSFKRTSASPKVHDNLASGTLYMKSPSVSVPIEYDSSTHDVHSHSQTVTSLEETKLHRQLGDSAKETGVSENNDQFSLMRLWLFK